jgi:hypothetical protein
MNQAKSEWSISSIQELRRSYNIDESKWEVTAIDTNAGQNTNELAAAILTSSNNLASFESLTSQCMLRSTCLAQDKALLIHVVYIFSHNIVFIKSII